MSTFISLENQRGFDNYCLANVNTIVPMCAALRALGKLKPRECQLETVSKHFQETTLGPEITSLICQNCFCFAIASLAFSSS